jgi:hypothetical protein
VVHLLFQVPNIKFAARKAQQSLRETARHLTIMMMAPDDLQRQDTQFGSNCRRLVLDQSTCRL